MVLILGLFISWMQLKWFVLLSWSVHAPNYIRWMIYDESLQKIHFLTQCDLNIVYSKLWHRISPAWQHRSFENGVQEFFWIGEKCVNVCCGNWNWWICWVMLHTNNMKYWHWCWQLLIIFLKRLITNCCASGCRCDKPVFFVLFVLWSTVRNPGLQVMHSVIMAMVNMLTH